VNRNDFLSQLFQKEYQRVKVAPAPECQVSFYPYRGLTSTIRSRDGRILIRISDLLSDAPGEVLQSVVAILIGKLLGTQVDDQIRLQYNQFVNRPEFRHRTMRARRQRGVKQLSSSKGRFHDLLSLFNEINKTYFENKIRIRHLSWSRKPTRTTLGHFDAAHETIIINKRLDNPRVPPYVLSYVIYHEMLHALLGEEFTENGRRIHHRRFREAEKKFEEYSKAKAFIRDHYSRLTLK